MSNHRLLLQWDSYMKMCHHVNFFNLFEMIFDIYVFITFTESVPLLVDY